MRRIVGPNRILGLLVLALSLHPVCPATDYNSRLELFNPTAAPADVQRSSPKTSSRTSWTHTGLASSELRASLARPQFREGQIVHGAIPIYQKALPAAYESQFVEDRYESSCYASCSLPRASGRAPPRLTA